MATAIVDSNPAVLLSIYTGNVTGGAKDGTFVSRERAMTAPISVLLDSSNGESKCIKCAIRCNSGYKTSGTTTIGFMYWDGTNYQINGGAMGRFKIALDNGYTEDNVDANASWVDSIDITDEITDTNVVFWIKISSVLGEAPVRDNTISLTAKGVVVAVS